MGLEDNLENHSQNLVEENKSNYHPTKLDVAILYGITFVGVVGASIFGSLSGPYIYDFVDYISSYFK